VDRGSKKRENVNKVLAYLINLVISEFIGEVASTGIRHELISPLVSLLVSILICVV
jgi:hypothetical protein